MYVATVSRGLPAGAAGLQPGDRIAFADGRPLRGRDDWAAVDGLLEGHSRLVLIIERAGQPLARELEVGSDSRAFWSTSAGVVLALVRLTQLATLAIALLVAFKRPDDWLALLGAWLLASGAVFCIVFPSGMAAVWHRLPIPLGVFLWIPFASSFAIGAILFTFFATFPRPVLVGRWIVAASVPATIPIAWFVAAYSRVVYDPATVAPPPQIRAVMITAAVYAAAGLVLLPFNYRRLEDVNDRRRVRVIMPGSCIGLLSGVFMLMAYWGGSPRSMTESLFASPGRAIGVLLLLALPVSFAYAILRRRLFDVSTLIRQGVRYALARRIVLSIVPLAGAILIADVASQAQKSLREVVAARRTLYLSLIGVAVFAHLRRPVAGRASRRLIGASWWLPALPAPDGVSHSRDSARHIGAPCMRTSCAAAYRATRRRI